MIATVCLRRPKSMRAEATGCSTDIRISSSLQVVAALDRMGRGRRDDLAAGEGPHDDRRAARRRRSGDGWDWISINMARKATRGKPWQLFTTMSDGAAF